MAPTATESAIPAASLAAARRRIAAATRALMLTHIAPDGDAVGSLLGFGLGLRALGKDVTFACADPIPDTFRFLTSAGEITHAPRGTFDLIVSLDAADLGRLGGLGEKLPRRPDILFDHHLTNDGFADINLIDVQTASTAELVTELLEPLGLPLTLPMAEALLTGIINDTLGFRTSNTSAKSLAMAQKLIAAGANLGEVYDRSFYKRSFYAVRFWGEGLINLRLEDRIVWATLTLEARRKAGYTGNGDADLINVLSSVREADVAVVFVERNEGKVKISWRASPGLNVAELAAAYGGGGHAPASGAEVTGTLAEVEGKVIAATKALLKSKANSQR